MHPTHCLISTQVRVKYGFIKVYAVGVYVSPRVALDKRAASPLAALRTARADSSRLRGELDRTKALLASRPAAPPPAARAPPAPQAPGPRGAPPADSGGVA